MARKSKLDATLEAWVRARRRHRLSHAHVQMTRKLGMNPAKLGKLDNHDQKRWKAPLPTFIEAYVVGRGPSGRQYCGGCQMGTSWPVRTRQRAAVTGCPVRLTSAAR
jgi:hypothetical protein